jgi:large subunit ribosomal protein L25
MEIPVRLVGQAPGVAKGGLLVRKRAALKVFALPKDMPDHIDIDCSSLDFHHAIKVSDINIPNLELLDPKAAASASVEVPRAAKLAEETAATPAEGAAAPAAAAPAAGAAPADAKKAEAPKKDEKKK